MARYKSALFNELYVLADGGTVWLESSQPPQPSPWTPRGLPAATIAGATKGAPGLFAVLQAHSFRLYNATDVQFYASFALSMLWPRLQKGVIAQFAASLSVGDRTVTTAIVPNK